MITLLPIDLKNLFRMYLPAGCGDEPWPATSHLKGCCVNIRSCPQMYFERLFATEKLKILQKNYYNYAYLIGLAKSFQNHL